MIFIVLYIQVLVQVLSEAPPASPQDVHVDKGLLTWTPATDETNITYTVESFDTVWSNVPSCLHISFTSCCVKDFGCVMLRVQAERHGLTSRPAEACSRHGDICTPEVNLTARPGSLTVHLRKNHSMTHEHGDHAKHRVYYGKEGEPLEMYVDAASSVSIDELQGGQRYCTKVQYINMGESVGLPRCTQCKDIPKSENPKRTEMTVAVVVVVFLVTLIPVISYILIFQRGRIKEWLRPQYNLSDHLFDPVPQHYHPISTSCPDGERIDVISCFTPENQE